MPQTTLSLERLGALLPRRPSPEELTELLFASKAEVAGVDGDALRVEATADRLDLLCEGGLAAHLNGVLGGAVGLPPIRRAEGAAGDLAIEVDPSVAPVRPAIAALVVEPPGPDRLGADLLDEAVRFQELLHATFGLDRRTASLGIYPAHRLRFPLRYAREPAAGVAFVPLDGAAEVRADAFLAEHPMGRRYGPLGAADGLCLTLRDSAEGVLSLPPILNARPLGEARPGDGALLLESTGTRAGRVLDALGLLSLVFVARGWAVRPVEVRYPDRREDGAALVSPRSLALPSDLLRAVSGTAHPASEVEHLLAQARLGAHPAPDGWRVEVPPWRPDLLTERDLIEEVVLARGVRPEEGIVPPSPTRGRRLAEVRFRRRVASLLLGLGCTPLYRPVLSPERLVRLLGRAGAIALANPVSEELAYLRDALQLSLVAALERNVRHGYPQRLSEVGPVVVPAPGAETGGETRHRAGVLLAGEGVGFAEAAALVDHLLRAEDVRGIREPAELPGTLPGRAARMRLAGEPVAEVGEIHPRVLDALRVPVPVAWAEVDLTALWPLLGPGVRPPTLKPEPGPGAPA